MATWSYWKTETGPQTWSQHFPSAGGVRQSPIDITPDITVYDPSLGNGHFKFDYDVHDCYELYNKGTTWAIKVKENCNSTLTAIHLPGTYRLIDIHGHWGNDPNCGSEHLISGVSYSAEIHIVHMNTKYKDSAEAVQHGDGLAVLGILIKESDHDNPALEPLVNHMKEITFKGDVEKLTHGFNAKHLLPENKEYWTYEGSLTTPPCSECVIWTLFRSVVPASKRQLEAFRQIYSVGKAEEPHGDGKIVNNYRVPQPICERKIRSSFIF